MKLSEAYRTRPIRFLELWKIDELRLKVYGITYTQDSLDQTLVDVVLRITSDRIIESTSRTNHYDVGFVIKA